MLAPAETEVASTVTGEGSENTRKGEEVSSKANVAIITVFSLEIFIFFFIFFA